jgi:cytochrome c2
MPKRRFPIVLALAAGLGSPALANGGAPVAPVLPDTPEALAEGAAIFERRCSQCHGLDGVNYKGPWLNGILDRPSATVSDWAYSPALRAWGGVWSVENLQAWLTKPQDFIPGIEMNFGGFRSKTDDRDKLIAWLIRQPPAP